MSNLSLWSGFLARQAKAPPLVFVHGMRHPLISGVCCAVHAHSAFEIVYHPKGHGITRLNRQINVPFREGSVVIYAPHEPHDQVMEEEGNDFCIQVATPGNVRLPKGSLYIPHVENRAVREDIHLLSHGYPRLSATEQAIFNFRATALLLDLIQSACTRRNQDDADPAEQHVLKAEQFIRENFPSIKSLGEVARHVGVSQDHLRHVFKTLRGKTLVRHLGEVRIERAMTLLRHSRLPLKQIAAMCGFKDEYYFSAVFRRFTQTPPGVHRHSNVHEPQ